MSPRPRGNKDGPVRVGEIRPSSMMTTFGIGSVVDLPRMSVVVKGLDGWPMFDPEAIVVEPRLMSAVHASGLHKVKHLVTPPPADDSDLGRKHTQGVGVQAFPDWLVCPACRRLARRGDGVFKFHRDAFSIEKNGYRHENCGTYRNAWAIPVRFVAACENGHLDDFPWVHYVHGGGPVCEAPLLKLRERGATGSAADVFVECEGCKTSKPLAQAFGDDNRDTAMVPCTGRHPHLGTDGETCDVKRPMRAMLLGASNLWFPVRRSALTLPAEAGVDPVVHRITRHVDWPKVLDVLKQGGELATARLFLSGLEDVTDDDILQAAGSVPESGHVDSGSVDQAALLREEWEVFARDVPERLEDLETDPVGAPTGFESWIERIVRVPRLREVSAVVGFTRIESPFDDDLKTKPVRLKRNDPEWLPVSSVRGEGVFVQLREEAVRTWVAENSELDAAMHQAHATWRRARGHSDEAAHYPGLRYVLLHTLSHVLMRRMALSSGYSQSSIRERIYCDNGVDGLPSMAGLLLMTAAPDSEGTLGGLVAQGDLNVIEEHLSSAIREAQRCSADPYCGEHHPEDGELGIHGAACHACLFAPETSCERGNRYLDRSVIALLPKALAVPYVPVKQ
jgi:hypothetical protein